MYNLQTRPHDLWHPKPFVRGLYENALLVPTLLNSAAVAPQPPEAFASAVQQGGQVVTLEVLPSDLSAESEPDLANKTAKTHYITSGAQLAVIYDRKVSFHVPDVAIRRTGRDIFMDDLNGKFGRWLGTDWEKELVAILRGLFGPMEWPEDETGSKYALGGNAIDSGEDDTPKVLSPDSLRRAKDKFGHLSSRLTTLIVHSAVSHWMEREYSSLYNGGLGASSTGMPGSSQVVVPPRSIASAAQDPNVIGATSFTRQWQGLNVEVSDAIGTGNAAAGVYPVYLAGDSVILTAQQGSMAYEPQRVPQGTATTHTFNWSDVIHINGTSWKGTGETNENAVPRSQLSNPANWGLKFSLKSIPLIRMMVKVPATT